MAAAAHASYPTIHYDQSGGSSLGPSLNSDQPLQQNDSAGSIHYGALDVAGQHAITKTHRYTGRWRPEDRLGLRRVNAMPLVQSKKLDILVRFTP
jgi:hypothetical protein